MFSILISRPTLWWFLELVNIQQRTWLWGLAAVYPSIDGSLCSSPQHRQQMHFPDQCLFGVLPWQCWILTTSSWKREREKSVVERNKGEEGGRKAKTGCGSSVRFIGPSPPEFWLHSFSHPPNNIHGQSHGLRWNFKLNKCLSKYCLV